MIKQVMPPSYKGGRQKWQQDYAKSLAIREQSLVELLKLDAANDSSLGQVIGGNQLDQGLFHTWAGESTQAHAFLHQSVTNILASVERQLPSLTSQGATALAGVARDGACAAAVVGQDALARTLFQYAHRFAAALVTGDEDQPAELNASLDVMGIQQLVRAYSLIRLGRLSGFQAVRFVNPPAEVSDDADLWAPETWGPIAWAPADIYSLLDTAETCWRLGKPWRGKDWASEKGLFPLLRALAASLEAPQDDAKRAAAQAALLKYYRMIRDLGDFHTIYLLVLDLQRAYPHIFTPVAPAPL
jgi:hypothetical protein